MARYIKYSSYSYGNPFSSIQYKLLVLTTSSDLFGQSKSHTFLGAVLKSLAHPLRQARMAPAAPSCTPPLSGCVACYTPQSRMTKMAGSHPNSLPVLETKQEDLIMVSFYLLLSCFVPV